MVNRIDYDSLDEEKKEMLFTIIIELVTATVRNNEFEFVDAIKKQYSQYYAILKYGKRKSALLFSLLSMYFFYMCERECDVPNYLRKNIKKFVYEENNKEDIEAGFCQSWVTMYRGHVEKFEIDLYEMYKQFILHKDMMEYWRLGVSIRTVTLNATVLMEWYLTNFLMSYNRYKYRYQELLDSLENDVVVTRNFISACEHFLDDGKFVVSNLAKQVQEFYKYNRINTSISEYENNKHELFDIVNNTRKEEIVQRVGCNDKIDNDELAEKYRRILEERIQSEWGYDADLQVVESTKYLRVSFEKDSEDERLDNDLIELMINKIFEEIRKNIDVNVLRKDDNFEEKMNTKLFANMKYISRSIPYIIKRYINDEKTQFVLEAKIKEMDKIESNILLNDNFLFSEELSFNCVVEELSIENLDEKQLAEAVEDCRREDGQYVYYGAFMTREEVEEAIGKSNVTLTLAIRSVVDLDANENYFIKLWDDE